MTAPLSRLSSWLPPTAWAAVLFFLSSLSFPPRAPTYTNEDKVIHLLLYATLGLLLYRALRREHQWSPLRTALLTLLAASLYGVSDEIHQFFVPTRSCDWRDWLADTAGAAVVLAVAAREHAQGTKDRRPMARDD